MIQFHETVLGRMFYEGTMPGIARSTEGLLKEIRHIRTENAKGIEELTSAVNRLAQDLEAFDWKSAEKTRPEPAVEKDGSVDVVLTTTVEKEKVEQKVIVCPEWATREALDAAGISEEQWEKLIVEISEREAGI